MRRALAAVDAGRLQVAARHEDIVRRWRTVLDESPAVEPAVDWSEVHDAGAELGQAPLDRFFARCDEHLEELLADEVQLQALLFDEDAADVAAVLYSANPISELTNAAAGDAVAERVRECGGRLPRILEVGAGTGATTRPVFDALREQAIEYLFTDVGEWFLNQARIIFAGRSGLSFARYDVNTDEVPAGPWDAVVAGNVLHNLLDPDRFLDGLRRRMAPGGRLVLVETGIEHHPLLISVRFLMSPPATSPERIFADDRGSTGRIFLTRSEWIQRAESAGWRLARAHPDDCHPLSWLGQFTLILECSDEVETAGAPEQGGR